MKQGRGELTERIKAKSMELFGYEITRKELRLMPYIIYEAQNNRLASNTNGEEKEILDGWVEKGFLQITGMGNIISISEDFFVKANKIIYLGYVDLKN